MKIKIKEMYLKKEDNGSFIPVYLTEDGREYIWKYQPTGNCWMIYVEKKED